MTTTDPAPPEPSPEPRRPESCLPPPVRPPLPPAPRWAVRAARVAAWSTVPSGLWRVALVLGVPVGVMEREEFLAAFPDGSALIGLAYVLLIGAVAEVASYLTLGLVRPWGDVVPRRFPLVGGRLVNAGLAVLAASLGALTVTVLWWVFFFGGLLTAPGPDPGISAGEVLFVAAYAPLLLWGPLLAAVTWSYHRRHRARPRP
ncbi:hypothetical protein PV749_04340 [Streptomyces sp. ID03-2B]|uniref:hypothetical protein n=1 Tax=Streptomyces TaxID=1883 RepID=UPI0020BDACB1|nr:MULTISPECIES: hypothetical protein [unclassified Streptomyces]MCL6287143.1 hypothetical protein [Streptomyces sp. 43Y-GA-1]MDX3590351.1 hypothetical protein [Streptomyces sp. ID03-2B]